MGRCELVKRAIEILNKAKNTNFIIENIYTDKDGGVHFTLTLPNGFKSSWGYPDVWFDPEHTLSDAVRDNLESIPENLSSEEKIIAKLIIYFWSIRNSHCN